MPLPKKSLHKVNKSNKFKKKDEIINQEDNNYSDEIFDIESDEYKELNDKGKKSWNKYKKGLVENENQSTSLTIKQQTKEMIQNYQKGINENHIKVASMMSKGLRDDEIVENLNITYDYLDELRNNPAFIGEVSRLTSQFTLSNKDLRLQQLARISDNLFQSILNSDLDEMSVDQKFAHKTKIDKLISDMNDKKESINTVDITVRLKQKGIDIIKNANGQKIIQSEFPSLLDESTIINNDSGRIV